MYDQEDLTDLIDLIYEYNLPLSIEDICSSLGFSKEKVALILDMLYSCGLIKIEDSYIIPLVSYEYAILVAEELGNE